MRGRKLLCLAGLFPFHSKRQMNAAKREADRQVEWALRTGALTRKPCDVCGEKAEAHHEDYGQPLEVRWLCRRHHRARHAELKALGKEVRAELRDVKKRRRYSTAMLSDPSAHQLVKQTTVTLFYLMELEGLTLTKVAQRLGVSKQTVSARAKGGFRTLANVATFAAAIGYDAEVVFRHRAGRPVGATTHGAPRSEKAQPPAADEEVA